MSGEIGLAEMRLDLWSLELSNCNHLPVYIIVEGVVAAERNQGA